MNAPAAPEPGAFAVVAEVPVPEPPAVVHPVWRHAFPWLVQGTTTRADPAAPFDLGLFGDGSPSGEVLSRWERLRRATGLPAVVHAHQEHGAVVRLHGAPPPGLLVAEACDGHATDRAGVLLAVTTADCVPVSVVDPERRAVALLHAGWRGVAAGILERGLAVLVEGASSRREDLHVHLGPAICGACYEVGPEVFVALGLPAPAAPAPVDVRAVLAARAVAAGVAAERVTISSRCTLCGDGELFSHRRGDRGRQVGFLGIRP